MLPGDRFKRWIEGLSESWKDRLRGWVLRSIGEGITKTLEDMEPGAIESFKAALIKMRDNPLTPPEMVTFYDKALTPGNWLTELIAGLIMALGALPAVLGAGGPLGNLMTYIQERELKTFRIDPIAVMTAWWRDPQKYASLFDDLRDQGWSAERIEALKFYTRVMPSPRDIVGFLAHEVFEPDMVTKYSLLSEWDVIDKEYPKKIGLFEDELKLWWMDHWKHPEWGTIQELRHRDKITDQDVKDWFRLVEIPEYWRAPMLEVLWGLPNRIEIRMMARYLDMSKQEIMDLLKKAGLHEDFRADAADFMMIMGLTGYWSDMLRGGWMNPEEVKADIDARGFKPITAERIYKRLVKSSQPEKVTAARDLTVAQIIRWVKLDEVARRDQGVDLLMDLNYTMGQALFIMEGYLGELGSPETFDEFKNITQKYRQAIGLEAKPMGEEIKKAGEEVVRLTKEIETLNRAIEEEKAKFVDQEVLPEETTAKVTELQVARNRAESELFTARLDYDRLVAEWRHGE